MGKNNTSKSTLYRMIRTIIARVQYYPFGPDRSESPVTTPVPRNWIRETVRKTEELFGKDNKTGQGSAGPDINMYNFIVHGTPIPDDMRGALVDPSKLDSYGRLIAVMSRGTREWTPRQTKHLVSFLMGSTSSVPHHVLLDIAAPPIDTNKVHRDIRAVFPYIWQKQSITAAEIETNPYGLPTPTQENNVDTDNNNTIIPTSFDDLTQLTSETPTPTPTPEPAATQANDMANLTLQQMSEQLMRVPKLEQERREMEAKLTNMQADLAALMDDRQHLKDENTELCAELGKTQDKLKQAASASVSAGAKLDLQGCVAQQAATNDLDALASALNVSRQDLDAQMTSTLAACAVQLQNAVEWQPWCDPQDTSSRVTAMYHCKEVIAATGPSGTGKTFMLKALAQEMAGACMVVSCHEALTHNKLFSKERVGNGKTYYQLGPVAMAMLCDVPLLVDEFDHSDPFVQTLVHGIVDTGVLNLSDIGVVIKPGDNFRLMFTCNSLSDGEGDYEGEVATALKTRLGAVFVDYPTEQQETKTIETASGLPTAECAKIAKGFAALRKAEKENKLTGPFSVRESCSIGRFIKSQTDKLHIPADKAAENAWAAFVIEKRPSDEQDVARETLVQAIAVDAPTASGDSSSGGFMDTLITD